MNSVNEALYFGVPLVVPQQSEQLRNGRQAAHKGAAILLGERPPYGQVTMAALRTAVDTVLTRPSYREAAAAPEKSFRAAGGYKRAADLVEARVGTVNSFQLLV